MLQHPKLSAQGGKPSWLKRRLQTDRNYEKVGDLLEKSRLHTVCQEAKCPNLWECFSNRTATFLIMGPNCTRDCRFCAVAHGPIEPPDPDEPKRVAAAVQKLLLTYVVITSVTRDDLSDGGAGQFAQTITEIRNNDPNTHIEILVPDFRGSKDAARTIVDVRPDVFNHNVETVPRLYPSVRPAAIYRRSLDLLKRIKDYDSGIYTKSGLMLGLGEQQEEIYKTLQDLLDAGISLLTLGQYLQPTRNQLPVDRFVHPDEFDTLRDNALEMGFAEVASGPFVRSSYQAPKLYAAISI
jgi:lipoic acid synthetase